MWLFRLGQMLGVPALIGKTLVGWKIYILIGALAFSAGAFTCYKFHKLLDKADQADTIETIYEAEEVAQELKVVRETVYKDRIKEVIKYVEVNNTVECFDDDQLLLFKARD